MRLYFLAALLCLCGASIGHAATLAAWSEAVGDGESVRAIVDGACPRLLADGKPVAMSLRAAANPAFPMAVCQAAAPAGAITLSIDGRALPVWHASVNRIVVLGDTGCRLKHSTIQDCDDPAQWPFAAVAKSAAAEHPDLVIHVGDYYYRETPCPADHAGCAGSPYGDAWPSWSADFFDPARPLLTAAPWIFVRGNHEQCGRGALGWFRFLDAGRAPLDCPASSAPYAVSFGGLSLYIVDSADTEDASAPADKVALFKDQLDRLQPRLGAGRGWILTHRPIWGFVPPLSGADQGEIGEGDELAVNLTEQAAVASENLAGIQLVMSGHIHLFAAASFGEARPAQLIVGNGGDTRDGALPGVQSHAVDIAGIQAQALVVEQFGYLVLDRGPLDWRGTLKRADGSTMAACTLASRTLFCHGV